VGTITERLVFRVAATAKADHSATREAEWFALGIDDFEIAFHADIAIVIDNDFRCGHSDSRAQ
jgi:hypothetical protein